MFVNRPESECEHVSLCVCVRQKREVKLGSVMVSQNTNLPSFHQRTFCLSSDQENYNYFEK